MEEELYLRVKTFSSLHPLNNIETGSYFKYGPRLNGICPRKNLPRIKDGAYATNLADKYSKGKHWVSLYIDRNTAIYFYSFGIDYILQEVLNKIKGKLITHNIFIMQDNESVMCGFYCIALIDYMLAAKNVLDYTNFFFPNENKKNGKIILKYFKDKYGGRSKFRV